MGGGGAEVGWDGGEEEAVEDRVWLKSIWRLLTARIITHDWCSVI